MKNLKEKIAKTLFIIGLIGIPGIMAYNNRKADIKKESVIGNCKIYYVERSELSRIYMQDTTYNSRPNLLAFFNKENGELVYANVIDKESTGAFKGVDKDSLEAIYRKIK